MASINNKTAGAGFFGGGGGGSPAPAASQSPFVPAGFANVSTFSNWQNPVVDAQSTYIYVPGILASNSHAAIAQVKVSDGTVKSTCDLGVAGRPVYLAVSPDGGAVYAVLEADTTQWYKVTTSSMSLTHTSTLAVAVALDSISTMPFDLSPDGSTYAYVSASDDKVYKINTSSYAVSSVTVGHSDGGTLGTLAVAWYDNSSANFYVSYIGNASIDLYSAGVYTSTVDTTAAGTPALKLMRSGINHNLFIGDAGTNKAVIVVTAGTPAIYIEAAAPTNLSVDVTSADATCEGDDVCAISLGLTGATQLFSSFNNQFLSLATNPYLAVNGGGGATQMQDGTHRVFITSGCAYPVVYSFSPDVPTLHSAPGWSGSGTLSGGGTVTITTAVATSSSIISVSPTGTANVLPPAVTTKSAGSFVVTGTGTGTFDWTILKP